MAATAAEEQVKRLKLAIDKIEKGTMAKAR